MRKEVFSGETMKIYLACPYSHKDYSICESRVKIADRIAGILMKQGHIVFSPLSHSHPISKEMRGVSHLDHNFWLSQDLSFLVEWAEKMIVLCAPGWTESTGIKIEETNANEYLIPIEYWYWNKIERIMEEEDESKI